MSAVSPYPIISNVGTVSRTPTTTTASTVRHVRFQGLDPIPSSSVGSNDKSKNKNGALVTTLIVIGVISVLAVVAILIIVLLRRSNGGMLGATRFVTNPIVMDAKVRKELANKYAGKTELTRPGIFFCISSYRDPELCYTVRDLFTKAFSPERVHVAIVEQNDPDDEPSCHIRTLINSSSPHSSGIIQPHMINTVEDDGDDSKVEKIPSFDMTTVSEQIAHDRLKTQSDANGQQQKITSNDRKTGDITMNGNKNNNKTLGSDDETVRSIDGKFQWKDNISVHTMSYKDAKGPTHARALCEKMFRGTETYYMMTDSHMRFEPGWDVELIQMILNCKRPKRTVITMYPEAYERIEKKVKHESPDKLRKEHRKHNQDSHKLAMKVIGKVANNKNDGQLKVSPFGIPQVNSPERIPLTMNPSNTALLGGGKSQQQQMESPNNTYPQKQQQQQDTKSVHRMIRTFQNDFVVKDIKISIPIRRGWRFERLRRFNEQGIIEFESVSSYASPPKTCAYVPMYGACFVFSHIDALKMVPFHPETPFLFFGKWIHLP